jgi:hypothetical protein
MIIKLKNRPEPTGAVEPVKKKSGRGVKLSIHLYRSTLPYAFEA